MLLLKKSNGAILMGKVGKGSGERVLHSMNEDGTISFSREEKAVGSLPDSKHMNSFYMNKDLQVQNNTLKTVIRKYRGKLL